MLIRRILLSLVVVAALVVLGYSHREVARAERQFAAEVELAVAAAEAFSSVVFYTEESIPRGVALADFLPRLGVERDAGFQIVNAASGVFDMRRIRAGNSLSIGRDLNGGVHSVRYRIDPARELWIARAEESRYKAEIRELAFTSEIVTVSGEIRSVLFNAVSDAGERPELALDLADLFAWDMDFNTDTRVGDTFSMVVEKRTYEDGSTAGYGRILAAEYVNRGRQYQAFLFRDPTGQPAYYGADGQSVKKAFLRSPLPFRARVSSRFSHRRFHPVHKTYRPHLGIDYAVPTGTPVQAIGAGTVVFAGRRGGNGIMVHLRHANGFETYYLHLSRLHVRSGQRVNQGQLIGRVGATGTATGPHLDFRIRQNGTFRNFERLRLPPAEPVAKGDWAEFAATRDRWMALLPDRETIVAQARQSSPATSD